MGYESDKKYAKRIFVHYIRYLFQAVGVPFDSDNEAEIEAAVDSLLEAALSQARGEIELQRVERGK